MAKLIAISGTHGCGKTTLLNEIKNQHYPYSVSVDDFKASRTIQAQLGTDLSQITDLPTLLNFQTLVLEAKAKNDLELLRHPADVVIVERSMLDLIAYTQLWLYELDPCQTAVDWFNQYTHRALAYHRLYAATILISSTHEIPFVADPNRGKEDTRLRFEFLLRLQLHLFETLSQRPGYHINSECVTIPDRLAKVAEIFPEILKLHYYDRK